MADKGSSKNSKEKPADMAAGRVSPGLTSTHYVVLAENQRRKAALEETKAKYTELQTEVRVLQQEQENAQRENFEVTEYLRREILGKDEKIAILEAQVDQLNARMGDEISAAKKACAEREQKTTEEADRTVKDLQAQVVDLQEQLAVVLDFRDRRESIENELSSLREANEKLEADLASQSQEIEMRHVEASSRVRKDYEVRLEELRRVAEADLDDRLDASMKRILNHNRALQAELRLHIQETEGLQKDLQSVEEVRASLRRDLQLQLEMEKQYARRSTLQTREIRDLQAKVRALEGSMGQMLKDFELERAEMILRTNAQLGEAETECKALRQLVRLKAHELRNIRRLAQEVLLQRGDVETFLLSSLSLVRVEMQQELLESASEKGRENLQKDPLKSGKQIDIKDLSWEDRERVLRLLFAKINNQAQQSFYSNLPQHSFEDDFAELHGMSNEAGPAQIV